MSLTPSTMLPLGTTAAEFRLPDVVSGKTYQLKDFAGKKALLVVFMCQHCPYIQHIKEELSRLGKDYASKDMAIVGISANDAGKYPDDSPPELKKFAKAEGFNFPLLHDESQQVAKAYTAACTPDLFLFASKSSSPAAAGRGSMVPPPRTAGDDVSWKLVYRGQLDDSRPGNGKPVTGKDLRAAIEAVLADMPVSPDQRPATGCNIKWKPGNEPDYFG